MINYDLVVCLGIIKTNNVWMINKSLNFILFTAEFVAQFGKIKQYLVDDWKIDFEISHCLILFG